MRNVEDIELTPPPRLEVFPERPAVIEPRLHDLARYEGPLPDEIEPFVSERVEGPIRTELTDRIREVVLGHESVKRHVRGRSVEIGLSFRGKESDEGGQTLLFVLFDYDANVAVEVTLDDRGRKVLGVEELAYQPPPVQQELDRAIKLAASDDRLGQQVGNLEGSAILVSPGDPAASDFGHRQFDVRFGCPDERRPTFAAMVDLSAERVLGVGDLCGGTSEGSDHE